MSIDPKTALMVAKVVGQTIGTAQDVANVFKGMKRSYFDTPRKSIESNANADGGTTIFGLESAGILNLYTKLYGKKLPIFMTRKPGVMLSNRVRGTVSQYISEVGKCNWAWLS